MFDEIFFSPQVKQIVIISNRQGIYELTIDLRLRTSRNEEMSRTSQNFIEL